MNIVKLKSTILTPEGLLEKEFQIKVDDYIFFSVEYAGENIWKLIGHKFIEEIGEWRTITFGYDKCRIEDMAHFIAEANSIPDKTEMIRNRVSEFKNVHYSENFYKELTKLFDLVEKYSLEIKIRSK